jgi:hypothetical protein
MPFYHQATRQQPIFMEQKHHSWPVDLVVGEINWVFIFSFK